MHGVAGGVFYIKRIFFIFVNGESTGFLFPIVEDCVVNSVNAHLIWLADHDQSDMVLHA